MKEQDLRKKISYELRNYSYPVGKCVQIAKDYAEQEAIEFMEWIDSNCTSIIRDGKYKAKRMLLSELEYYNIYELYQLFKNRENER